MLRSFCFRRRLSAFSLIELMVVIMIISALSILAIPAFSRITTAYNLGGAGQMFSDQFNLARQIASAKNRPVEFRIYQLPSATASNPSQDPITEYRAFQLFVVEPEGAVPVGKVSFLPQGVIINPATDKSSILNASGDNTNYLLQVTSPSGVGAPKLPKFDYNYNYISFRFRSSGEVKLGTNDFFLTMHFNKPVLPAGQLPDNFVTAQINAVTGRVRVDRP
jgi:uncharacterized protein (TIGR02596 family)